MLVGWCGDVVNGGVILIVSSVSVVIVCVIGLNGLKLMCWIFGLLMIVIGML